MSGWEELESRCGSCRACPLCETRTNVVFGTGSKEAAVMFVGEAPGESEDLSGKPFVGRAGQLLDKYLFAVDLRREDVYIANVLKCRPPNNRDPLPEEEERCIGFLREQVRLIQPRIIVCLGRIAAMRLIDPGFKISAQHGQWFRKGNFWLTAVFHPAALLRDPSRREDMLTDMKAIDAKAKEI